MYKGMFFLAVLFSGVSVANDSVAVPECSRASIYYGFSTETFSDSALTSIDVADSYEHRNGIVGHFTKSSTVGDVPYELTALDVVKVDNAGAFLLNVKHITVNQDEATKIAAELVKRGVNGKAAGAYAAEKAPSFKSSVTSLPFRLVDGKKFESQTELGTAAVEISCF